MKTIGLLGGMSWESTQSYYRQINELIKARLGGLHSAKIVLVSVDFAEIEALQMAGDWQQAADKLIIAAKQVEAGGADFLLICTNTMHKVAEQVQAAITIPLLHIADATAEVLKQQGIQQVGLLGTAFTMEQDFYKGRLSALHHIKVFTPDQAERAQVHNIIYQELCLGQILPESKAIMLSTCENLIAQGAEAIILGCTEIGLLIQESDSSTLLVDTTEIHARKAVELALQG